MSDIIANAKQLLDGTTPAPWEHYNDHGIVSLASGDAAIATDLNVWDADLIADAPENTQALAKETWEYQVQARSMKRPAWKPSTNDVLQKWYVAEDIEEAKSKARMYTPYFRGREKVEILVLRRRVSKPEVVNE